MLHSHPQPGLKTSHGADKLANLCPSAFLMDPDHAECLIGRSQLGRLLKKEWFLFLFLAALGGFSLLIGLEGFRPLSMAMQLQQNGISVQGQIVGDRTAPIGTRGDSIAYYLKYSFTSLSGEVMTEEQAVSRQTFQQFHVGDSVPVKYLAEDPSFSVLAGAAKDAVLDFGNFLIVLMGGIGLSVTVGLIIYLAWQLWREELYFTRGQLVIGHVLACHAQMGVPWRMMDVDTSGVENSGRYMIDLSYTFRSPAGQPIKTSIGCQRNDLRGCRLPKFGNPIAVLYLSDKHYKLL